MLYGRLVHVGETFKRFADFGLRIARKLRLAVGHRSLQSVLGFFLNHRVAECTRY